MNTKNKNRLIVILCIIIIVLIVAILAVIIGKKTKVSLFGNVSIVDSLVGTNQAAIDDAIKKDVEENGYSLSNAKVYIDPYGTSPLSALIVFKSESGKDITVTVKGKNNDDIVTHYESEIYNYIPVYALYENYENTVEISLNGSKNSIKITTEKIEEKPSVTVNSVNNAVLSGTELYFITSPLEMISLAYDSYGELRWYTGETYFHDIVPLDNGHMLIGNDDFNLYGMTKTIYEIDYLGRIYREYNVENGYLNNITVKPDGNILVASKNSDRTTYSDYIVEIDAKTGKIVKTWDIYEMFKNIDQSFFISRNSDNYFYNSGIEYYEDTDTLLLTYWGGEFVLNLKYSTGNINWIFSNPNNFSSAFSQYMLTPVEEFNYPKSMHSATLNGDVLKVFDNGYSANKEDANSSHLVGSYSSANTYRLTGKSIKLESAIDEDKKFFSYALGDYNIANSKDELVLFGRELGTFDYSQGVDINTIEGVSSRLIEKIDGQTTLDLSIGIGTHTVDKIDVSKGSTFSFDKTKTFTTIEPSKKGEITKDIITLVENATESKDYTFGYSKNFIECNAYYMSFEEANLVLINDAREGAVYTLKVKDKIYNENIVTDLPNGKYYVYVYENGTMYKTDKYIEIK